MWQFDHIGLVVDNLEVGAQSLLATLPVTLASQRFDDIVLGVSVRFFKDHGGQTFELISPFGPKSPVANLASSKQGKINQLCYRCYNLDVAAEKLRKSYSLPLGNAKPALAFGGARVQFFWTSNEFVLELIEGEGDVRIYDQL